MANLKDLLVNGVSRFIGKVYINNSTIGVINNSTVGDNPKFTDTNTTYAAVNTTKAGLIPESGTSNGGIKLFGMKANATTGPTWDWAGQFLATTSWAGCISSTDKAKLDSIASSATRNTFTAFTGSPTGAQTPAFGGTFVVPQVSQSTAGAISTTSRTVTIPSSTVTTAAAGLTPKLSGSATQYLNGTGSWTIPVNTTYANATTSSSGLMSTEDKLKVNRGAEYIRGTWAAATHAWTGVSEDSELYDGKQIVLYMPYAGTSTSATLNLTLADGTTTGAKNVYFESTTRFTTHKGAYSQLPLIYHKSHNINGTNYEGWWYIQTRDTNDNTVGYNIRNNGGNFTVTTALYPYHLLFQKSETTMVPINAANNTTATTKTLTTEEFDPFGKIGYYPNTSSVAGNNQVGPTAIWHQYCFDLRYSANTGSTLTAHKDIYLVVVPQANGKVKLHTTPFTQTLPSSDDGLLYIRLGRAYSTYQIQLTFDHPIYVYKNGRICEYSQYSDNAGMVNGHTVAKDVPSTANFNNTTYANATTSTAGLMSGIDKFFLDNLASSDFLCKYYICETAANAATKVVGSEGEVSHLGGTRAGTIVNIAMLHENTVANTLSLSFNGGDTASTIYKNGNPTSTTNCLLWNAYDILTFIYTGSYWMCIGQSDAGLFNQNISLTAPTVYSSRCTIVRGGYYQEGKIVHVNVRVKISNSYAGQTAGNLLQNFPPPLGGYETALAAYESSSANSVITGFVSGVGTGYLGYRLKSGSNLTSTSLLQFSGTYIAE